MVLVIGLAIGLNLGIGPGFATDTQKVVDMAGRTVEIPKKITKVFSTDPMGTVFMYTLSPDKIAGLSWAVTEMEKRYTLPSYQKLPLLGGSFGGKTNTTNYEQLIKVKPDFILMLGYVDKMAVSSAEKLQNQIHVPVLLY